MNMVASFLIRPKSMTFFIKDICFVKQKNINIK